MATICTLTTAALHRAVGNLARLNAAANGNCAPPTREDLRIAIMLTWWEVELERCMRGQGTRGDLYQAQARVFELRSRIPADVLPEARAWVAEQDRKWAP